MLPVVNSTAVNIGVCVSFGVRVLSGYRKHLLNMMSYSSKDYPQGRF